MLKIRSRGRDRAQYCVILIKFRKKIANGFAKIINVYNGEFKTLSSI